MSDNGHSTYLSNREVIALWPLSLTFYTLIVTAVLPYVFTFAGKHSKLHTMIVSDHHTKQKLVQCACYVLTIKLPWERLFVYFDDLLIVSHV